MGKKIWASKTLWVNILAIIALIVQTYTGFVIDIEAQASILAFINVALRLITKQPISWTALKPEPPKDDIKKPLKI